MTNKRRSVAPSFPFNEGFEDWKEKKAFRKGNRDVENSQVHADIRRERERERRRRRRIDTTGTARQDQDLALRRVRSVSAQPPAYFASKGARAQTAHDSLAGQFNLIQTLRITNR